MAEPLRPVLRLAESDHRTLYDSLFPGDGREAVALGLCGVRSDPPTVYSLAEVHLLPPRDYRNRDRALVTWGTASLPDLLRRAAAMGLRLLKIHSHPGGHTEFSTTDDAADAELFSGAAGWLDTDSPGLSAIMLPSGEIRARTVAADGRTCNQARVSVAGSNIEFFFPAGLRARSHPNSVRTAQAFGQGTATLMASLRFGVVGCSGTGSPLIEMLARLGAGAFVLVDPQKIEGLNLSRIYNATAAHVCEGALKVDVAAASILAMGFGAKVVKVPYTLSDRRAVAALADCDVIFGCLDSVDGRAILNRIASYYCLPYFDLGVALAADGVGGVDQICGGVHYIRPRGASLLSMGVITPRGIQAEALARDDPEAYRRLRAEKYIRGVEEERPAVISVNTLLSALAVNEFLARVHPFRLDPNELFASTTISLTQARLFHERDGLPCPSLASKTGLGDRPALLDMPELSPDPAS